MDPITMLRDELARLKNQGRKRISIAAFEAWLAQTPTSDADDRAFEEWKARAPLEQAGQLEMFRAVMESGQTALKTLSLINGGAAIALLALLGNLLTTATPTSGSLVNNISNAMLYFVSAVGFVGAASALRYLTQWAAMRADEGNSRWSKAAYSFNFISIVFGALSLIGFFVGGWVSYCAFHT